MLNKSFPFRLFSYYDYLSEAEIKKVEDVRTALEAEEAIPNTPENFLNIIRIYFQELLELSEFEEKFRNLEKKST